MLYKLVVIFFAAAHGLPGAYKKHAKSAERLHALERTTGPKCCECKMSRQFKDITEGVSHTLYQEYAGKAVPESWSHCFEPASSIDAYGKKESCHRTCYGYGTYTPGQTRHVDCNAYKYSPSLPSHILRVSCHMLDIINLRSNPKYS